MENFASENWDILIPVAALVVDLIAGYIPDKYLKYIGIGRRVISAISVVRTAKKKG